LVFWHLLPDIVQAHVIFPAPDDAVGVRVAVISPTAVASIPSPVQSGIVPPTVVMFQLVLFLNNVQ
jgi:hypothetical protein